MINIDGQSDPSRYGAQPAQPRPANGMINPGTAVMAPSSINYNEDRQGYAHMVPGAETLYESQGPRRNIKNVGDRVREKMPVSGFKTMPDLATEVERAVRDYAIEKGIPFDSPEYAKIRSETRKDMDVNAKYYIDAPDPKMIKELSDGRVVDLRTGRKVYDPYAENAPGGTPQPTPDFSGLPPARINYGSGRPNPEENLINPYTPGSKAYKDEQARIKFEREMKIKEQELEIKKGTAESKTAKDKAKSDAALAAQESQESYRSEKADVALSNVAKLKGMVSDNTVGIGGNLQRKNPFNTDAKILSANLKSLKSQIAFSELAAMRAASKTGGALGAISDKELVLLESALGSLDEENLDPNTFRTNLGDIEKILNRWKTAVAKHEKTNDPKTNDVQVQGNGLVVGKTYQDAQGNKAKYNADGSYTPIP